MMQEITIPPSDKNSEEIKIWITGDKVTSNVPLQHLTMVTEIRDNVPVSEMRELHKTVLV